MPYVRGIGEFTGEYMWLSNFWSVPIAMEHQENDNAVIFVYGSVECAYMSRKSDDLDWKQFCKTNKAGVVKRVSRDIELRPDWHKIKLDVMRDCLEQKFNNADMRSKLIETYPRHITEGNWHGDSFWGVDLKKGNGENQLGKMLMEIRYKLVHPDAISTDGF